MLLKNSFPNYLMILFPFDTLTNNSGSISILVFVVDIVPLSLQWHSGEIICAAPGEADADQVHAQRAKRSLICNHLHFKMRD